MVYAYLVTLFVINLVTISAYTSYNLYVNGILCLV